MREAIGRGEVLSLLAIAATTEDADGNVTGRIGHDEADALRVGFEEGVNATLRAFEESAGQWPIHLDWEKAVGVALKRLLLLRRPGRGRGGNL